MKDNFSTQSDNYARYRPTYPIELFQYIGTICSAFENAWDCGTGNGQVAGQLATMFNKVFASDISQEQLNNAVTLPNIHYSLQPAEQTNFSANLFDLVMVAQAVHWFNFEKFYAEVKRTSKEKAIIVIVGYGRFTVSSELDMLIDEFYNDIIGTYWDVERKYIDENYATIPFNFEEIPAPGFKNDYEWTFPQLVGYLQTWSAVKHYARQHGTSPVTLIYNRLKECWGLVEKRRISFPLLLRVGKIHS